MRVEDVIQELKHITYNVRKKIHIKQIFIFYSVRPSVETLKFLPDVHVNKLSLHDSDVIEVQV